MGFLVEPVGENGQMLVKTVLPATSGAGEKKAKRRKTGENDTITMLDPGTITEVATFLEESGGVSCLSLVGSKFQVKRPQLEAAGFILHPYGENGQFQVSM